MSGKKAKNKQQEGVVLLIDIGETVGVVDNEGQSFLEKSKKCASRIVQRKIFANAKDELCLLLIGSEETKNDLNYPNINVKNQYFCSPNWNLLKDIDTLSVSNINNSDWLDGLIVAANLLKNESECKEYSSKKIVLMSNFATSIRAREQVEDVVNALKEEKINLVVIGVETEDVGSDNEDKSKVQRKGEAIISRIVEEADGVMCGFDEAMKQLGHYQKVTSKAAGWYCDLQIGSDIFIPIVGYKKLDSGKPLSWKKRSVDGSAITEEKVHFEGDQQLDRFDVINSYPFGQTIVPFSVKVTGNTETDKEQENNMIETISNPNEQQEDCFEEIISRASTSKDEHQNVSIIEEVSSYSISHDDGRKSSAKNSYVEPDDPSLQLPIERLEKSCRIRRGPYQPILNQYPVKTVGTGSSSRNRSFQSRWFEDFNWLEYSPIKDAAYCFACRCFDLRETASIGPTEDAFVTSGFSSWQKAVERFKVHEKTKNHVSSSIGWEQFLKNKSVDQQLEEKKELELKAREKQRQKNVEYMKRLVDIVRLLAKGGRPLRGHNELKDSHERGLFLEVVHLLQSYDPNFKSYLESAPINCTYLSNHIQNDILRSLSNVVLKTIQNEIRGLSVSIMADETSDVSHHEQMAIVLRFMTQENVEPVERFIGLERLKATDAETLFMTLDSKLTEMGIPWENVGAVCFDGASSMAGQFTGVQSRCKEKNPSILYVHCYAHCLNLSLVSACSNHKNNPLIFDFFGVLQLIYSYIEGSPKRHNVFEEIVKTTNSALKTLKSLSETRWACRAEAVAVVYSQFDSIVKAFEEAIENATDAKAKAKGKGILHQIKSFDFIICLEIMQPILQMVVKVSKTLQSSSIDLCYALEEVSCLALALEELRITESVFENMFSKAKATCERLEITIPTPKKRKPPNRIDENPASSYSPGSKEDEVRVFVFYPVLDTMIQALNDRFSQETKNIISATGKVMALGLDAHILKEDDIKTLEKHFFVNGLELEAEMRLLQTKKSKDFPPTSVLAWLEWLSKYQRASTFRCTKKILVGFATIPVTSCSCERSFSKLSIIKTKLRSTMRQDRLQHLMLPFIEQGLAANADLEDVIQEFKRIVPFTRRMAL